MATCEDCIHEKVCGYYAEFEDEADDCTHFINKADFVEVRHGEWIDLNITEWQCSECNYRVERWNNTPYCPKCGAKMDGKDIDVPTTDGERK